jgi:hypothetical protein
MKVSDDALSLQLAYTIAYDAASRSTRQLFWAADRLWHDRDEVDEHARQNRSDATQAIAKELDARGVPVRDPALEPHYPGPIPS